MHQLQPLVDYLLEGSLTSGEFFVVLNSQYKKGALTKEEMMQVLRAAQKKGILSAGQVAMIAKDL